MAKSPNDITRPAGPGELTGEEPTALPVPTADLEALRQELAELRRAQEADRQIHDRLRRELEENQAIVQRFMAQGQGVDLMALEARWQMREAARRRVYEAVAGKKVVITLHLHEDPKRNFPVHLALNGNVHLVPRGKPYEIPGEYLEVLDHAMVQSIAKEVNQFGMPELKVYDFFSYPYSVVRGLEGCDPNVIERAAA